MLSFEDRKDYTYILEFLVCVVFHYFVVEFISILCKINFQFVDSYMNQSDKKLRV